MAKSQHTLDQAEIKSIRFTWTINNFSLYTMKEVGYFLISPTFSYETESGDKTQWYLKAYPNGRQKENENHISLFLHPSVLTREEPVTFQFSIMNIMGEKLYGIEKELEYTFVGSYSGYGETEFIATTIILDRANGLLPNGALTICCDIKHSTKITKNAAFKKMPDCRIIDDLSSLFEKELFSDVTLTAQGEQFNVHKNILAARSSVFAAMFLSDMKEKNQDVIEILDMSKDVLRAMLSFIYSGKAPGDESIQLTSDLLVAADKYDLERLKVICEKALCMKLNVENACDLLVVADLHNACELKASAMDFINNEISAVLTTETRMPLIQDHPRLFNEILDDHLQCKRKNDDKEDEDDE